MRQWEGSPRDRSAAIGTSIAAGVVFEALAAWEIEDKAAWAVSPWREDPYHTAAYLVQFAVPVLLVLIVFRLVMPGGLADPDRAQQTVRAAALMVALIGLTYAFEWAAVVDGANPAARDTSTTWQITGLAGASMLTVVAAIRLARCRQPRGSSGQWRNDWLGDVAYLGQRIPVLRRWAGPNAVTWVRDHAMAVFVALSALVGLAITGAQAIGEGTTDPVLIGWFFVVETGANLAFCVIGNAVVGFIARPRRTRIRAIAELSVVAGCLTTLAAIAFHDTLWSAFTTATMSTEALVALTLGAGVAGFLATAAVLYARGG